jgi:hypothetical protein
MRGFKVQVGSFKGRGGKSSGAQAAQNMERDAPSTDWIRMIQQREGSSRSIARTFGTTVPAIKKWLLRSIIRDLRSTNFYPSSPSRPFAFIRGSNSPSPIISNKQLFSSTSLGDLGASAFRFCPAISQAVKMGMALGKRRHD